MMAATTATAATAVTNILCVFVAKSCRLSQVLSRLSRIAKSGIGIAPVIEDNIIVIGNFQSMIKQRNAIPPVPDLCPCNNEKTCQN